MAINFLRKTPDNLTVYSQKNFVNKLDPVHPKYIEFIWTSVGNFVFSESQEKLNDLNSTLNLKIKLEDHFF